MTQEEYALAQTKRFQLKILSTIRDYEASLSNYKSKDDIDHIPKELGMMKILDVCKDLTKEYESKLNFEKLEEQEQDEIYRLHDHVTYSSTYVMDPIEDERVTNYMKNIQKIFAFEIKQMPGLKKCFEEIAGPLILMQENIESSVMNYLYTLLNAPVGIPVYLVYKNLIDTLSCYLVELQKLAAAQLKLS